VASSATNSPSVTVAPAPLSFGPVSVGTAGTAQAVTLSNSGTATLKISSIAVDNAAFSLSAVSLPLSLAPGKSTPISVTFKPSAAGAISAWLSISSNGPYSPNSVAISGTGVASSPEISVAPSSLSFGSETVGSTSAAQTLTVTNTGTVNATVSSIASDNTGFALTLPTLPQTLAPGKTLQATATFKPTATGALTGWVSITSNGQYSPNSIAVSGTGVAASSGTISASPGSLAFSRQTVGVASAIQTITVSNTGSSSVTLSSLSIAPSQFAFVSTPTLPVALAAGGTSTFSVAFTPTAASTVTGSVTITSTASPATTTVALSGTGIAATDSLTASPTSLTFSSQPLKVTSTSQSITVTNAGTGSVSLTALSASPATFTLVSPPTLPLAIGAGKTASFSVEFTPTAGGRVTGSVTITSTASPATTTVSLSGTGAQATTLSGLSLLTTSLHAGFMQQAYSSSLAASGGVTPYTWSVSSGALPPGLTLGATTGLITGTPTQDGTFTVGIQSVDSTKPTALGVVGTYNILVAAGVYDQYGGITEQTCSNGPKAHFYTQEINSRWWLCTPAGNGFWLRGVYDVNAADTSADYQGVFQDGTPCTATSPASVSHPCSVVVQKYGDAGPTWGPQTVQRLKAWGFNSTAEYSSTYVQATATNSSWTTTADQSNPQKMPFTGLVWPSHYSRNTNSYAGPVKNIVAPILASVYSGDTNPSPDVFDPNFAAWLAGDLADYQNAEYNWIHSSHSDYLVGLNIDDTDELVGFGAGVDFEALVNGEEATGMAHPHLGWIVLVTPPTQASGKDANGNSITYTNTTVYSKQAFSTFMSSRYSGNIASLNTAWGSTYTTFGSSGGWDGGTGLLDEAGTHSWVPKDSYGLSGATAAMQADLNAYLLYHAQKYFSVIKSALTTAAPGILYLGPTNIGGWGAPPRAQILQAAGQYVDVIPISSIPTGCLSCTDDQAKMNFIALNGGNKPWINWEGDLAQPDSYMSPFAATQTSFPQSTTQVDRGLLFQTMITQQLTATDTTTSTYHIVGYKWWQFYDDRGEASNWGLATRRDNSYDGKAAVIGAGKDSWGFSAGGELMDYGDFLDDVTGANLNIYKTLLGLP